MDEVGALIKWWEFSFMPLNSVTWFYFLFFSSFDIILSILVIGELMLNLFLDWSWWIFFGDIIYNLEDYWLTDLLRDIREDSFNLELLRFELENYWLIEAIIFPKFCSLGDDIDWKDIFSFDIFVWLLFFDCEIMLLEGEYFTIGSIL